MLSIYSSYVSIIMSSVIVFWYIFFPLFTLFLPNNTPICSLFPYVCRIVSPLEFSFSPECVNHDHIMTPPTKVPSLRVLPLHRYNHFGCMGRHSCRFSSNLNTMVLSFLSGGGHVVVPSLPSTFLLVDFNYPHFQCNPHPLIVFLSSLWIYARKEWFLCPLSKLH